MAPFSDDDKGVGSSFAAKDYPSSGCAGAVAGGVAWRGWSAYAGRMRHAPCAQSFDCFAPCSSPSLCYCYSCSRMTASSQNE